MKEIRFKFKQGPFNTTLIDMQVRRNKTLFRKKISHTNIEMLHSRCPEHIVDLVFKEAAEQFKDYLVNLEIKEII